MECGMPDFPKRKSGFLRAELSSLRLRLIPRMHHRLEYTGSQNVSLTIADPVDSERCGINLWESINRYLALTLLYRIRCQLTRIKACG